MSAGGRSDQLGPDDVQGNADGEVRYAKSAANSREYLTLVTTPYTSTTPNQ